MDLEAAPRTLLLHRHVAGGAVGRAGVQIPSGGGDARVPERGLDDMDGGAALQSVGRVGVAQPVGRHPRPEPGPFGGVDQALGLAGGEMVALAGAEHQPPVSRLSP
jgi:hypothetical protein